MCPSRRGTFDPLRLENPSARRVWFRFLGQLWRVSDPFGLELGRGLVVDGRSAVSV